MLFVQTPALVFIECNAVPDTNLLKPIGAWSAAAKFFAIKAKPSAISLLRSPFLFFPFLYLFLLSLLL